MLIRKWPREREIRVKSAKECFFALYLAYIPHRQVHHDRPQIRKTMIDRTSIWHDLKY